MALAAGAQLPYLVALVLLWRGGVRRLWSVLAVAAVLRLILVAAPPVFSDDIYRYIWDGRVALAGFNPFEHAPDAPALAQLRDPDWERINHRELKTIYPPASQLWFAATAMVGPSPTGFKLLAATADLAVVWLVILLARRRARCDPGCGRDPTTVAAIAGAAYGWNPLVCIETGMSGHLEPLAMVPLLVAVLLMYRRRAGSRAAGVAGWRSALGAGASLGLACGTKLVPLLLLPTLGLRNRRIWLVAPLVLALLYLPFLGVGHQLVETLDTFARRWEGNGSLFALVRAGAEAAIGWVGGADRPDALVHVPLLDGLATALQGGFFSLHKDGGFDAARPGAWPASDLALVVAKTIGAGVLLAVIVRCVARRTGPVTGAYWVFGALIVVAPVVHPWYLLWVLPFAALRRGWPWLWLTATMPLAYLPLERWWSAGSWQAPPWIALVEYLPFYLALCFIVLRERRAARDDRSTPEQVDRAEAVDPPARSK